MDFSAGTVTKINEHVIEVFFSKDAEVGEKMSIELMDKLYTLSGGQSHALLYNFNKRNVIISDIARKLSVHRNYNNVHLISRAIVSQNMASGIESAHYINYDKPDAETKLFNSKDKAFVWLNEKVEAFLQAS
ncbi:MAG TPA: hypothetical protein VK835_11615 [Bacteroidia bacterium]|jgi:hypothetical protein|nr:hypothetical protein [Bacteroidia bacterium]